MFKSIYTSWYYLWHFLLIYADLNKKVFVQQYCYKKLQVKILYYIKENHHLNIWNSKTKTSVWITSNSFNFFYFYAMYFYTYEEFVHWNRFRYSGIVV